jgi:uncharacterized protein YgiM (DUF1202 family)
MGTTDNNFWIRIQQGLRETEILMNQQQFNLSMIKARQTLEYMVNYLGEKALIVEGDLADSIDQLFEGRLISQTSKDHYHRIRMIGNKAVHEGSDSPYDAGEALKLLAAEVHAFAHTFHRESPEDAAYRQRSAPLKPVPIASGDRAAVRSSAARNSSGSSSAGRGTPGRGNAHQGQRQAQRPHPQGSGDRKAANRTATTRQVQRGTPKGRSRRRSSRNTPDTSGLLKPALIFLGILVLVLIFVKLVPGKGGKQNPAPTETSSQIETEATSSPETTEAVTEEETEAPKTYTTKSKLNVRSTPSTDGTKLGSLAAGTKVEFVKTYDDTWTVITFEGKEAYIATEFLTVSEGTGDTDTKETTATSETTKKAGQ